ncbi:hypothetical protein AAG906_018400 [Vitis piasezkii]
MKILVCLQQPNPHITKPSPWNLVLCGAPMGIGVALLNLFGAVKDQHLWDVPVWLPFLTTFIAFGASALGIAYGTLYKLGCGEEGFLLGLEEAQQNWVDVWKEEEDSKR